jgi:molybdenum cofactor cytidylyltransferase
MTVPVPIACVVLAAGGSTRLGHPKQLIPFRGQSLVRRSVEVAVQSKLGPVVVVLGAAAKLVEVELAGLCVHFVSNKAWESGIGSSLSLGITLAETLRPKVSAALVTLCDQPKVTSEALQSLASQYFTTGKAVVASSYSGTLGVPALFDWAYFEDLKRLDPLKGAKPLLRALGDQVAVWAVPEASTDIDTAEDWEKFLRESETT